MGIRIRRKLGYGLTDVQYDKEAWKFSDPRINASSFLLDYETDKPDMADYREWLETNAEDTFVEGWYFSDLDEEKCRRCRPEDRLDELVTHDPEFGEPGVLLIRPLGYRDWQRYDDSIDYYDANMGVGAEPCVKLIDGGLYPFMGGYVDVRSGEKLGDKIMWWVRAKNGGNVDPTKLDILAQTCGFRDHAEALEFVHPEVPAPIANLCRFGQLFTSDEVIRQLRPMLYTYWS